jgi:hypothetical protein
MVYMPLSERVGLLASRTPIAISILQLGTIIGVVSCFLALEAGDVTQILPHWGSRAGTLVIVVSSIPIAILMAIVVVSIASMLEMTTMVMSVVPPKLTGS